MKIPNYSCLPVIGTHFLQNKGGPIIEMPSLVGNIVAVFDYQIHLKTGMIRAFDFVWGGLIIVDLLYINGNVLIKMSISK